MPSFQKKDLRDTDWLQQDFKVQHTEHNRAHQKGKQTELKIEFRLFEPFCLTHFLARVVLCSVGCDFVYKMREYDWLLLEAKSKKEQTIVLRGVYALTFKYPKKVFFNLRI